MFNIFTILSILVSVNTYLHDPPLDGIDYWASRFFIYSRFLHKFIINFFLLKYSAFLNRAAAAAWLIFYFYDKSVREYFNDLINPYWN